jgi:hypothetical protein
VIDRRRDCDSFPCRVLDLAHARTTEALFYEFRERQIKEANAIMAERPARSSETRVMILRCLPLMTPPVAAHVLRRFDGPADALK